MKTSDFDYYLPEDLIAQHPLEHREDSRLLVLDRASGTRQHRRFADLPSLLRPDDVLVFNESKVIPARLRGKKPTGGRAEALLVKPLDDCSWLALTKPGLRLGQLIVFGDSAHPLCARVTAIEEDGLRHLKFDRHGADLHAAIWGQGEMPTPPYIHEKLGDPARYQTVYAREEGSVAAPTAGLHFTPEILAALQARGNQLEFITLHVGLGTFQPIKTDEVTAHQMHSEYSQVPADVAHRLQLARQQGRRIVAVGTTSVRTLEAAADESGDVQPFAGETRIFIYPGYRYKAVKALITNFHLPKSTLLMLVCALAGRDQILDAYAEAVAERYRFFSFGDAMLIN